jgi:DNA-binding transcriptional ArsR family regulator
MGDIDDDALVRVLKALADPTRFRIIQEVAAAGEITCGALGELFDLSQPTISHHLKALGDAGVLVVRNEGKHHHLSVNHALLGQLGALVPQRLGPKARASSRKGATGR